MRWRLLLDELLADYWQTELVSGLYNSRTRSCARLWGAVQRVVPRKGFEPPLPEGKRILSRLRAVSSGSVWYAPVSLSPSTLRSVVRGCAVLSGCVPCVPCSPFPDYSQAPQ